MAVASSHHTVNTTNATPTVISSRALAVGAYRIFVYARQTGTPRDDYYTTLRIATLFQDDEATWVADGATLVEDGSAGAVSGNWDIDAQINGANFEIRVTGEAAKNITWTAFVEHLG